MKYFFMLTLSLMIFSSCNETIEVKDVGEISLEDYNNLIKGDTVVMYIYNEDVGRTYLMNINNKNKVLEVSSVKHGNTSILILFVVVMILIILLSIITE